jgi:hypothetical protein
MAHLGADRCARTLVACVAHGVHLTKVDNKILNDGRQIISLLIVPNWT